MLHELSNQALNADGEDQVDYQIQTTRSANDDGFEVKIGWRGEVWSDTRFGDDTDKAAAIYVADKNTTTGQSLGTDALVSIEKLWLSGADDTIKLHEFAGSYLAGGDGMGGISYINMLGQAAGQGKGDLIDASLLDVRVSIDLNSIEANVKNLSDSSGESVLTIFNAERAWGGSGDDEITGNGGNNELAGGSGADTIKGGAGKDTIYSGSDIHPNTSVVDDGVRDEIDGGAGADDIYVGKGDLILDIDAGDRIFLNDYLLAAGEGQRPPTDPCDPEAPEPEEADDGVYEDANGTKYTYEKASSSLKVERPNGDTLDIRGYKNGDGGIILRDDRMDVDQAECRRDPLIIDLDGDRNVVRELFDSFAYFDLDNDGFRERVAWSLSQDGFLVRDLNGNGAIDDGTEMFGSGRMERDAGEVMPAGTAGFAELAVLDSNADGLISALDAQFDSLRVWVDANGDAITDDGELRSLAEMGIVSISLKTFASNDLDCGCDGTEITRASTVTFDGGNTTFVYDAYLSIDQYDTREIVDDVTIPSDFDDLPYLVGSGTLSNLDVAMARDPLLEQMVREFAALDVTQANEIGERVQEIILRWTGADQVEVDSRGTNINARWLHAIEQISGSAFNQAVIGPNPRADAASILIDEWEDLLASKTAQLLGQTGLGEELLPGLSFASAAFFVAEDGTTLGDVLANAASFVPASQSEALTYWKSIGDALAQYKLELGVDDAAFEAALDTALANSGLGLTWSELDSALIAGNASGTATDSFDASATTGQERPFDRLLVADGNDVILDGGARDDHYVVTERAQRVTIKDVTGDDVLELWGWDQASIITSTRLLSFDGDPEHGPLAGRIEVTLANAGRQVAFDVSFGLQSVDPAVDTIVYSDGVSVNVLDLLASTGQIVFGSSVPGGPISGDSGTNYIFGRSTADIYELAPGTGVDFISDLASALSTGDELHIDANLADVTFSVTGQGGRNLKVSLNGSDDAITIGGQFAGTDTQIETFVFADGTQLTAAEVHLALTTGTSGDDTISGTYLDDVLDGMGGSDLARGGHGDDRYIFGPGYGNLAIEDLQGRNVVAFDPSIVADDIEFSLAGADIRISVAGSNDTVSIIGGKFNLNTLYEIEGQLVSPGQFLLAEARLAGTSVDNTIYGTAANETITGTNEAELIVGNGGNDFLNGGFGNDTYLVSSGKIRIADDGFGFDTLLIDNAYTLEDLTFVERNNGSLMRIRIAGDDIRIDLPNRVDYSAGTPVPQAGDIEQILFADGQSIDLSVGQVLVGDAGDNILFSYAHSAQSFTPGAGNDRIFSINGRHTVTVSDGFGHDELFADDLGNLTFSGIAYDEHVSFARSGYDFVISVADGADTFTIKDLFEPLASIPARSLVFSDTTLSLRTVVENLAVATNGDDLIYGRTNLDGGAGNDILIGTSAANNYTFARGYGNDVIKEQDGNFGDSSPNDTLTLVDINPDDVAFSRHPSDPLSIVITILDTGETLTLDGTPFDEFEYNSEDSLGDGYSRGDQSGAHWIERIIFADGSEIGQRDIEQLIYDAEATSGSDELHNFGAPSSGFGNDNGTVLDGGAGNDRYINSFDDIYVRLGQGSGSDLIVNGDKVGVTVHVKLDGLTFEDVAVFEEFRNERDVTVVRTRFGDELVIEGKLEQQGIELRFEDGAGQVQFVSEIGAVESPVSANDQTDFLNGAVIGGGGEFGSPEPVDDTFLPGGGDDYIFGKGGLDTVEINFLGNGLDHLITSNQGRFQIVLGPDFSRDDFTYSWLGDGSDNVLLSFNDLGDGVIVSAQAIVGVEYADGITISFDTSGTGNVTELFPGAAIFFNPSEDSVYEALNGDVTITLSSLSGNDTFLDSYLSSNGAIAPVPPPGWETNTLRLIDGSALNDFEFVRDTSSPEDMVVRNLATGSSIRVEGQFAGESLDLGSVWTAAPLDALGNPDWSQVDLDADGEAEFARLDTDGDSVPNWANPDADGDGTADWESYTETVLDADGDGIIDLYAYDDNDDGTYDAFWLQGGLPPGEGIYFYDTDGDNIVDHYDGFTDYDLPLPLNPDGSVDWDAIDEDGNGVPDIAIIDFDGDGAPDWDAPDIDQDGTVDWTIMSFEEFYVSDPFVYVSRYTDLASGLTTYAVQNGNFSLLARDTDGDGTPDEFAFDDDYDLVPDTPQINYVFGRVELHLEQPDGSITTEFYDWQDISGALVERNESAGGQDFTINLYASRPVPTAGDDVLSVAPNETIDGLAGNDMIFADDGRATILFGIGSGSDVLIQKNINNFIDNNEVELAGVFALEDLIVLQSADGRDLVVEIAASGDRLRIVDQLARDSDENHHPVVTSFILNSGEVVSWKTMLSLISGIDTAGDGVIVGSSEGAVLNGGEGNDSLFGGPGDDIYDFGRSYDEDVIRDSGGNDIVRLADGIGFSDLYFSRTGNKGSDLLVEVMGLDRLALTIKGQFSDGNARIEAFELADGTTIGWRDVQTFILDQERTGNDDEIAGFETSDIISGGSGNDVLTGLRGDDLILGGSGRDAAVFRGSQGQYTISTVDGMTTVTDLVAGRDGTDTLEDVEDLIFEGDGTQVALVAPNSAPTATNTSVSGTEDEDVVIARADFLALAGDADGDALQLSVGNGANGRAWIGLDGDIYFRPDANFNGTASFDYTVADGNGGTATGLVSIDVAAVNDAPELSEAFDDQTFFEDEPVSFAVPADLFVDPDGDAVDISVRQANSDPLPSWLTYAGGLVEGTPPADFNGAFDLEVVGSDGQATTSTGFTLTILARNDAPEIVTPLANSEVVPGQQLSMAISESNYFDVEGDPLALEVLLASGDPLPSWLTYANGLLQGTVPADFVDTLSLVVLISDGKATIGEYFDIAPAENVAPVVALALSNVSVDEDTAVSIAIPADAFTDPDGDTLAYTAQLADGSALPGWLSFDGSTFTGTPPADFNGEFEIEVTASDGALSVSDTFVLTVNPVNDAPVIAIALADVSSDEDTPVSITVPGDAFVDVDGDTLTFTATLVDDSSLPAWLTFDGTTFTGTPPANFNGIVDIKVTASDGSLSVSDIFSLTIVPENDAPVLDNPLVDVSSDEDQPVNVVLPADAFSDPDGDALTYTARLADGGVLPGWLTFDGSAFTGTPPADFNGELDIEVTASDGALSVSDTLRLTINPVNDAPAVALTLTDQTVDGSANVDFAVPIGSFTDVDGDTLSYSATLADGSALPAWLSFDAGTQSFSGTAPNVDATLNIRVTASDGALSVFDDFTLTVEADGTGEGSTGGFSFANLNSWYNPSWGGGYNVTFDYTVQADAILDGELMAWDIIASYDGPGTIVNGWLSGFPGSASFVFDADSATFSTVGQSYQPDLTEGSTFQLSLQIDDAPYTEGEFDFVIFDRDPPLNLADAGDTEIEPALTNDWGTGLTQDVVLENTSSVLIDEWHVILDTPDGVDIDITNVWGATATELANGDIRFDPLGWNEEIAANGTVNFGFNANYSGVGSLQFTGADFTFA